MRLCRYFLMQMIYYINLVLLCVKIAKFEFDED